MGNEIIAKDTVVKIVFTYLKIRNTEMIRILIELAYDKNEVKNNKDEFIKWYSANFLYDVNKVLEKLIELGHNKVVGFAELKESLNELMFNNPKTVFFRLNH